ncbi:MAG: DUF1957 domain-containing protein [Chloroflexi bacterium]|nr:DUF1957 domain-containing protein [Chloroflexota bacterium]
MDKLRVMILGLLAGQDLHGYQLRRAVNQPPYATWVAASRERILETLGEMVGEGLLAVGEEELAEGRPARLLYMLTDAGREMLSRAIRAALAGDEALAPELAAFLLQVLPRHQIRELLQERVDSLRQELEQAELDAAQSTFPALRIFANRRTLRLRGELEWAEALAQGVEEGLLGRPAPTVEPAPTPSPFVPKARPTPGLGAFTFVLHSHLPYCRLAGRWPHGEEWIHEAAAETYVPLLNALYDLRAEGVPYKLTLSVTPVLMEQLCDAEIQAHFLAYLDEEIRSARADVLRFGEEDELHLEYLAGFYRDYYQGIKDSFLSRFGGDLIGALRTLQDEGYVQVITCAATHGYLPLLSRDASIYSQLRTAIENYRRHLGRSPRAIWLPECAYRPAYVDEDGTVRPALEEFLAPLGLTCFFAETHAIEGSAPVGKAAGDVAIGPYSAIKRRYVLPQVQEVRAGGTTYAPYYVSGSARGLTEPPVAVIGRNNRTGQQVWSGDWGYPGDADYREFHKKDDVSGLQYWRVTGPNVDLGAKDYYHPDWAANKVQAHAQHFAGLVEELLREYHGRTARYGIISANYDTELFGHWWFEGIEWIKQVLRRLADSEVVDLTTASEYLDEHEPEEVLALPESSWGVGGNHWTWDNEHTEFMWPQIHRAEQHMEQLVARYPEAEGDTLAVLNQAARELLLLQASDWPFLVTTGQAREYAVRRFHQHLERFQRLAAFAEAGLGAHAPEARALADELYHLDNLFPEIDYRWFAPRQGKADG